MKRVLILFVALFALTGCSQDEVAEPTFIPNADDVYYASFEEFGENSRTYIDENIKLLWHEDDRISLFRTTLNEQWKFSGKTGDNAGGFEKVPSDEWVTGNPITTSYAVYPYLADTRLSNDEVLQIVLPAVQTYAENSFGRGANTMVAAAESSSSKFLPFRNAGGYLVVKLYGSDVAIKSIELKGNNNEILAGAATAEAQYGLLPLITMGAEGSTTITLNCGEGVQVGASSAEATSFWLVVPPVTFEKGFTITITDVNGGIMTKSTSKEQVIVRNEVKSMAAFEPSFEGEGEDPKPEGPANNEIWYTSTDGAVVTPHNSDVFGATITSNTYENGKGVIAFDGDVTIIGESAFETCRTLVNVTLPNSVTEIGKFAFNNCFALTDFDIPNNVNKIDEWAFHYCTNLTSITIPESTTSIGSYAFAYCSSLKEFKGKFDVIYPADNCRNSQYIITTLLTWVNEIEDKKNVEVVTFEGLIVDALQKYNAQALLRGIRAFSDFEYELQMALMNRSMREECETVFMMPSEGNSFVSSRMVKEVARLGGRFEHCVPPPVVEAVWEKCRQYKENR